MSALGALGAALTTIGGIRQDKRKEALLERLEKEKEERAEQRQVNREQRDEQRERAKPTGDGEIVTKDDGSLIMRLRNSYGDVVKERPLDKTEVEAYQRGVQKEKISLESLVADVGYKGALTNESNSRVEDAPLERELKRSQIEENRAQAARAARDPEDKPDPKTKDRSLPGLTNYLIDQFADLKKQYTEGQDASMTADEFRQVAMESIKIAAQKRQDARIIFQDALRRFGKPQDPAAAKVRGVKY